MKRKDRTAEKNSRDNHNGKTNEKKGSHGGKAAADPKRFSGDGSAPLRLSVWFSALFLLPFRGVCLAAARVSAAHLSMPSTRHGAKFVKTTKNRTSTFCRSPNQINKYLVFLVLRAFPIISYVSIFQIGCRRRGIFEI